MKRQGRLGFTLIELLVVIAIIAILAAILFPVLLSAKASARRTQCASNCKQLGTAVTNYLSDWSDTFPPIPSAAGWEGHPEEHWAHRLLPYVKNRRVFRCPNETVKKAELSYFYNGWLGDDNANPHDTVYKPRRISEVRWSSRVVELLDCLEDFTWYYGENTAYMRWKLIDRSNYVWAFTWWTVVGGHDGWDNMIFVDGHVKCYKTKGVIPIWPGIDQGVLTLKPYNISMDPAFNYGVDPSTGRF